MSPRRRKRRKDDTVTERLFAGRTPAEGVTKEEWTALGYAIGGHRTKSFGDDPIGTHRHPAPETPTT